MNSDGSVLTDLAPGALRMAVSRNLQAFLLNILRSQGAQGAEGPGWAYWRVPGVAHPWFNGGWCGQELPQQALADLVGQALADFRSNAVGTVTWWLDPALDPRKFSPVLEAAGFKYYEETPAMAMPLAALPAMPQLPPGVKIKKVEEAAGMRAWTEVFVDGYGLPPSWLAAVSDLNNAMGWELPVRNYIALVEGEPAAVSSLFLGAGVAGVYNVATLEKARGRGLGTALTLAPLIEARAMGYQAGILQSSEMGFSIYRRIGFEHLGDLGHFYGQATA